MEKSMIILASGSPRRIEMMKDHGITSAVIKPTCNEELPKGINGEEAVMFLSLKKALDVEAKLMTAEYEGAYIIAADTIVYNGEIIGKPRNQQDARTILEQLNGKAHDVITGVSILRCGRPERCTFAETTKVFFKHYCMDELKSYIESDEPYDKAGAYAIQGTFGKYIDHIEGDMNNVIGFPWDRIVQEFDKLKK